MKKKYKIFLGQCGAGTLPSVVFVFAATDGGAGDIMVAVAAVVFFFYNYSRWQSA